MYPSAVLHIVPRLLKKLWETFSQYFPVLDQILLVSLKFPITGYARMGL